VIEPRKGRTNTHGSTGRQQMPCDDYRPARPIAAWRVLLRPCIMRAHISIFEAIRHPRLEAIEGPSRPTVRRQFEPVFGSDVASGLAAVQAFPLTRSSPSATPTNFTINAGSNASSTATSGGLNVISPTRHEGRPSTRSKELFEGCRNGPPRAQGL
jgi:hypothetical protein